MSEITTWWICSDCDYPNEKDNVPCDNCSAYYDKLVPWIKRSELEKLQQENAEMREALKEIKSRLVRHIANNTIYEGDIYAESYTIAEKVLSKNSHLPEKLK